MGPVESVFINHHCGNPAGPFSSVWHGEPPSKNWEFQFLHSPFSHPTSTAAFTGWLWRESVPKPCSLTTGVPQGSVLGPFPFNHTQLILSFPLSETQVTEQISARLADISQWMSAHHLKLNLDKTELLFVPGKASPVCDLFITTENSAGFFLHKELQGGCQILSCLQLLTELSIAFGGFLSFVTTIAALCWCGGAVISVVHWGRHCQNC